MLEPETTSSQQQQWNQLRPVVMAPDTSPKLLAHGAATVGFPKQRVVLAAAVTGNGRPDSNRKRGEMCVENRHSAGLPMTKGDV